MTRPNLPDDADRALRAWAKARESERLPPVAFAAADIPPRLLPMSMCYRRTPDGSYIYSLVGDEIAELLLEDPRGTTVLHSAPDAERRARYALVDRAIDDGRPFWFESRSKLTDGSEIAVGRLGLPATNGERKVLLMLYFVATEALQPGAKFASFAHWDESTIVWLDEPG